MKLREIQAILEAEVFTGADKLDLEVEAGFGSDLMSDVLAFACGRVLLLTGLTNAHVIHTAAMIDAAAIVFVRGKRPDKNLINAAANLGLPLLGTRLLMYDSCGRLFQAGLKGCSREAGDDQVATSSWESKQTQEGKEAGTLPHGAMPAGRERSVGVLRGRVSPGRSYWRYRKTCLDRPEWLP
ncbi:DRTGG [Moorella glycerini]|uniref:DRTGG domain protein n=1 Tax=Neomoorella stamsii TaxID=1266720 RepID=A0A9X7P5C1_9FIRM|nr:MULTISPECIES: hypothetical protein [Moorella]PRR71111.1 DRTGG domain protein [Moorella stamsii]CEP67933.1 DRTGG [Moorella glycerini]